MGSYSIGVMNILRREPVLVTHVSKAIKVKEGTIREVEKAAILEALEKTSKRLEITAILAKMIKALDSQEVEKAVFLGDFVDRG